LRAMRQLHPEGQRV